MTTDVVIATDLPSLAGGGERVLQLARWLQRDGLGVEIIALGEGTKPDLETFRSVAPTTVVDRFRRRGVAAVPHLVGAGGAATRAKGFRLRRWLDRRRRATWLLHHPMTASLVRYSSERPARVVAAFPDQSWSLDRARPEDRDTLATVDGWLASTPEQAEQLREWYSGDIVELDAATTANLVDPADLPSARAGSVQDAVVLLPSVGTWDAIDHAVEIAWALARRDPSRRVRWVADSREDRWLARHDVAHAGLDESVEVVTSDTPGLLDGVAAVVRTGYSPSHPELVLAAAFAGVPVTGTDLSDLPGSTAVRPFDVEELIDGLIKLLDAPDALLDAGRRTRDGVAHLGLDHHISAVADLLVPGRR